jgi:hypothetical protein
MVVNAAEKGPPALIMRWWPEAAAHIPSDPRLSDLEAEHHQLTMNARAPEQVLCPFVGADRAVQPRSSVRRPGCVTTSATTSEIPFQ